MSLKYSKSSLLKYIFLILLTGFVITSCKERVEYNSENQEYFKTESTFGKEVLYYKGSPFTGILVRKDEDIEYQEGKRNGKAVYYYHDTEKIRIEETYKNDELEGQTKWYNKDGVLTQLATYKEGIQEGPFERYYDNGQLRIKTNKLYGEYLGQFVIYDENGDTLRYGEGVIVPSSKSSSGETIKYYTEYFYLHPNGVTIMCPESEVGDLGIVDGVEYESVGNKEVIYAMKHYMSKNVCTSLVTTMDRAFLGYKTKSDDKSISHWDVSSVTDMYQMFGNSSLNQPIGNWDVSNVTDMRQMFYNSTFNQDISSWCVEKIPTENRSFSTNSPLAEENKPIWGTCPD